MFNMFLALYLLFVVITYVTFRTHKTIHKFLILNDQDINCISYQFLIFMLATFWPLLIIIGCLFFILYGCITILEYVIKHIQGLNNV